MSEGQEREPDLRKRLWSPLLLSVGFSLSELIDFALQIDNTKVGKAAIRHVSTLLTDGCEDEHQWRDAIYTLGEILHGHPDISNYSGTWYEGKPTVMAIASAQAVAITAVYKLYPSLYENGEIEGSTFKALKYLLRAWAQVPNACRNEIKWLERVLNLR